MVDGCAGGGWDRPSTWINRRIRALCIDLHHMGYAHSIEVWRGEELVGGLYGVALKGAFFGESMFSAVRDASKIALVHLVARLIRGGFSLLDTQFATAHLAQFGAIEIPRAEYRRRLALALDHESHFQWVGEDGSVGDAGAAEAVSLVQSTTQIS